MCALWCNTHVHFATRCVTLLVLVLSKSCAIIVFGSIQCHPEWIGIGVSNINTLQNAIFFVSMCFITFCQHVISLYTLILLWQSVAVNLHVAHKKTGSHAVHEILLRASYCHAAHEVWITCSTQNIACVQHMKVDSYAPHCMSHASFD